MDITIRKTPADIFKIINKKRLAHMAKCRTCKYGLGAATIAYIRELQRNQKPKE